MKITYFAPADPRPPAHLSDLEYAAAHCRQIHPTRELDLTLAELEAACRAAALKGRKGDAGYLTACHFHGGSRRDADGGPAALALIDQDEGSAEPDWATLDQFEGFAWTTSSHRPDKPSWRVVIPFVEPVAHGKLRCPFRGGFVRNRTQPAFLPTHVAGPDAIQWRRLGGSQRLDAAALGGVERAYEDRPDSLLGAAFAAAGMVVGEQHGGVRVRCPWAHRHSDQGGTDGVGTGGTVILHSDPDNRGFGKFHCSRTECMKANPTSWDALAALKAGPSSAAVIAELAHWPDPGLNGYRRSEVPVVAAPVAPSEGITVHVAPAPTAEWIEVPEGQRATPQTWGEMMNQKHVVLTCVGGKCRVLSWTTNDLGWRTPVLSSLPDFRARYAPQKVLVEGLKKPVAIGDWWLDWRGRAEAESMTFRPDVPSDRVNGKLNLWRGYGVTAAPGSWALTLRFMHDVVAKGVKEHFDYILRWCAWVMQFPGEPAEVVLVLRGRKGTGKNTILDALCKLMGQHAKMIASSRHLVGNFNAHLADCALLFANEAIAPSDKSSESILKTIVTEKSLPIERKGIDVEWAKNNLSIAMASNEEWCVPAGLDERRFAVFDVSDAKMQDHSFFAQIHAELRSGGYEAMLHDLLTLDLQGWHPRQGVPKTSALVDNQLDGLRGPDRIVHQMLELGVAKGGSLKFLVGGEAPVPGSVFVPTAALADDPRLYTTAAKALARCCAKSAAGAKPVSTLATVKLGFGSRRMKGFVLPPLAEARDNWARSTNVTPNWSHSEGGWTTDEVE